MGRQKQTTVAIKLIGYCSTNADSSDLFNIFTAFLSFIVNQRKRLVPQYPNQLRYDSSRNVDVCARKMHIYEWDFLTFLLVSICLRTKGVSNVVANAIMTTEGKRWRIMSGTG